MNAKRAWRDGWEGGEEGMSLVGRENEIERQACLEKYLGEW